MKHLTIYLSLLLITTNAYAEWTLVDTDKDNKYYVDLTSSKIEGKTIKAPAYINRNKMTKEVPYLSEGLMVEFDCKGNRLRVIFFAPYKKHDLEGEPEDSMRIDDAKWMPSNNKGLGAMFNKVCKG
ncbi:hypothetical protein FIT80_00655 [Candidatus Methylopumilus universalis]|uniref:surface-adhesin E family protein n=1 Tax=Candidatus Methylopumilus universalis TaxID=2588536 RepID=UPI001122943B|nr:surface-adhesin E family protein [Candidatus Methylopumilus universalis]QDC90060.1 hypothetical protein FIT80_00655 [Candidatus Methylopumilus universalis]